MSCARARVDRWDQEHALRLGDHTAGFCVPLSGEELEKYIACRTPSARLVSSHFRGGSVNPPGSNSPFYFILSPLHTSIPQRFGIFPVYESHSTFFPYHNIFVPAVSL
jgi:hypothetical protein